ncbi:hypothetical protein F5Y11DRAFT_317308 [Daldinia sp. FL1419]|nr:hypothetical protein F5Y11DRAFT_317308 [Daldinia sp. FL1419]
MAKFGDLPLELRQMIWEFAFPGRRLVVREFPLKSTTRFLMPAVSHVCGESLDLYLAKQGKHAVKINSQAGRYEWFNPKLDVVGILHVDYRNSSWDVFRRRLSPFVESMKGLAPLVPLIESMMIVYCNEPTIPRWLSKSISSLANRTYKSIMHILERGTTLHTVNIFPSGERDLDSFYLGHLPSELNTNIERLFGNDSALFVDMKNKDECENLLETLNTSDEGKKCAAKLRSIYQACAKNDFAEWAGFLWSVTLLCLLSRCKESRDLFDQLRAQFRPLQHLTPAARLDRIKSIPAFREILDKLPQIRLVLFVGSTLAH